MKQNHTTQNEKIETLTPTSMQQIVDGYFETKKFITPTGWNESQIREAKIKINERYDQIQRLKSHPKTIEYARRILDGENIQIELLSPNTGYALRYLVAEMQKQRETEKTEALKDLDDDEIEQLYQRIPIKYRSLDVETIRDVWIEPIRIDDPTRGRDFKVRKEYILDLIEKQQRIAAKEKAVEEKKKEIIEGASVEKVTPQNSPESIAPNESTEVQLNKKIELDHTLKRISKQEVFGDSNGSYTSFIEHLQSRRLIKIENQGEIVWIGGNTRVTFLGDILGDRMPEGEKIYTELVKLKKMAQKEGGDVSWLAGNHENMFNAVLFGFTSEKGTSVEKDMEDRLTSYVGNLEMARYLPDQVIQSYFQQEGVSGLVKELINNTSEINTIIEKRKKIYDILKQNPNANKDRVDSYQSAILEQENSLKKFQDTYNDPSSSWQEKIRTFVGLGSSLPNYALVRLGQDILNNREKILEKVRIENPALIEGICQQKLVTVENDVLNCHTNFTRNMMFLIEGQMKAGDDFKTGVDRLNKFYQNVLQWYASPEPKNPPTLQAEQINYFNKVRDEFISTSKTSRINYTEDSNLTDEEKSSITSRLKKYGINLVLHGHNDEDGEIKGDSVLPILSLDRGAYKGAEGLTSRPIATASISTSGTVSYY